ncbi:glycosyltransferase [Polluticaenibacter yanchengensis]|uniref:Glycosyltransferase n=1 Tax=Polluticaenibacter yanchengensis TaxID=3014562 RepID=A0ABT4UH66_9BACT|nr:glycosyltransferase [Chitinophagaceae bacterium LY-5]
MAIRVLRIINRFVISGSTFNVSYLTKYLPSEFETVLISGHKDDGEENSDYLAASFGLNPVYVNSMRKSLTQPWNDRNAFKEIKKIIETFKPHIVHTHAAKAGFVGRLAAISCNVPIVLHTFEGHYFHSYFHPIKTNVLLRIERYLAAKTDGIIAISPEQYDDLANIYKVASPEKVFTLPIGLDIDKFTLNTDRLRADFRNEFKISDDTICIGIIGRLVPIKNLNMFVRVVKEVLQRTNKKVKFFIVGDGESREDTERQLEQLNLAYTSVHEKDYSKPVIFTSWRKDIDCIMAGIDIVALTSLNEGTPVALMEAQAAKKAIVSTNVGGIGYVVEDGKSALLAESNNVKDFSDKLLTLIENESLRNEMGQFGYENAQAKFSLNRFINDTKNLYHKLLQEKGVKI